MTFFCLISGFVLTFASSCTAERIIMPSDYFSSNNTAIDGPHVFHAREETIINYVQRGLEGYEVLEKRVPKGEVIPALDVVVEHYQTIPFKVNIRPNHPVPASVYPEPNRLFAISDIEGNFEALAETLQKNGVVNQQLQWTFGDGHLVCVGDFFDRGDDVTASLWLIYALEEQAERAGGQVHFIIGNHEMMNLSGDDRYVRAKYKNIAKSLRMPIKFLYGKNTELGRWLRSKNAVEKIGTTLFAHGGISPVIASNNYELEYINDIVRKHIGQDKWKLREKGGQVQLIMDQKGPLWYRGYFNESLDQQVLHNTLAKYGAERIVVGHTVVKEVCTLYGGKVIAVDVKHKVAMSKDHCNALLLEQGQFYSVSASGRQKPLEEARFVDARIVFKAIKQNDPYMVKRFIDDGNDINGNYADKQFTLLHYAIRHGKMPVINIILEKGADINKLYEDKTPLMYAIKHNRPRVVRYLLQRGADINVTNSKNKNALFYAARYADIPMVKLLISKGAECCTQKDRDGNTPSQYAFKSGKKEVAGYLKSLE